MNLGVFLVFALKIQIVYGFIHSHKEPGNLVGYWIVHIAVDSGVRREGLTNILETLSSENKQEIN